MFRDFRTWRLRSLLNSVTTWMLRKNLISNACTYDRILSVTTQDSLVRIGTKIVLKIESFASFHKFSFHDNRIVQSSHYCTRLADEGVQFSVLPSVTRECNPKILELLYLLQCRSFPLQHASFRISWKMKHFTFSRAYFYSGGVACICKAI